MQFSLREFGHGSTMYVIFKKNIFEDMLDEWIVLEWIEKDIQYDQDCIQDSMDVVTVDSGIANFAETCNKSGPCTFRQ